MTASAPFAVRAATLTFAVGVVGFLVFHASATAGCATTPSKPTTEASPTLSVTVPAPDPNAGPAADPRYFPATKAGTLFRPPQKQQAGKATPE